MVTRKAAASAPAPRKAPATEPALRNVIAIATAQEAGAVFFGPLANYNYFSGDVGAGIIDLGTGNVVE